MAIPHDASLEARRQCERKGESAEAKHPPVLREAGGIGPKEIVKALLENARQVMLPLQRVAKAADLPHDEAAAVYELAAYQLPRERLQGLPPGDFRESAHVVQRRLDHLVPDERSAGCENR